MFPGVWHWSKQNLKDKKFNEKTSLKSYKIEGVPVAEHGLWLPGSILTSETILGGTSEVIF